MGQRFYLAYILEINWRVLCQGPVSGHQGSDWRAGKLLALTLRLVFTHPG